MLIPLAASSTTVVILGIIWFVLLVTLGVMSIRKGHWVMFIIGIFIPIFWIIGALMPPKRADAVRIRTGGRTGSPVDRSAGALVRGLLAATWRSPAASCWVSAMATAGTGRPRSVIDGQADQRTRSITSATCRGRCVPSVAKTGARGLSRSPPAAAVARASTPGRREPSDPAPMIPPEAPRLVGAPRTAGVHGAARQRPARDHGWASAGGGARPSCAAIAMLTSRSADRGPLRRTASARLRPSRPCMRRRSGLRSPPSPDRSAGPWSPSRRRQPPGSRSDAGRSHGAQPCAHRRRRATRASTGPPPRAAAPTPRAQGPGTSRSRREWQPSPGRP